MGPMLFLLLIYVGPGVAAFVLECLVCRLTQHRFRPLRLLPAVLLAIPVARAWEAWQYRGLFWQLTLLSGELVALSMALGLLLGYWVGFLWAKRG